jgi:hypothetical protein
VTAARRISLPLPIDLLSITGNQVAEFWQTVDLGALGEAVSWAGPGPAPAWLDAAREFSEYWTHHQQICEAIGPGWLARTTSDPPAVSLPSRRPDTPASTATSTWRQHRGRLVFTEGRGA